VDVNLMKLIPKYSTQIIFPNNTETFIPKIPPHILHLFRKVHPKLFSLTKKKCVYTLCKNINKKRDVFLFSLVNHGEHERWIHLTCSTLHYLFNLFRWTTIFLVPARFVLFLLIIHANPCFNLKFWLSS